MTKTIYEITHEGNVVRTIASESPDVVRHITDFMITLSDENAGEFTSWRVEIDPETGRKCTRIASAKNGVKI